jgi:hypothetical protein
MLHTHLESFTSESAIIGLELTAQPVRPGTEQFGLLEKGLRDPHQLAETLARSIERKNLQHIRLLDST